MNRNDLVHELDPVLKKALRHYEVWGNRDTFP